MVSIHAPTRGATIRLKQITNTIKSFNPRTHTGCDGIYSNCLKNQALISIIPRTSFLPCHGSLNYTHNYMTISACEHPNFFALP